eukprot:EG_transcript_6725
MDHPAGGRPPARYYTAGAPAAPRPAAGRRPAGWLLLCVVAVLLAVGGWHRLCPQASAALWAPTLVFRVPLRTPGWRRRRPNSDFGANTEPVRPIQPVGAGEAGGDLLGGLGPEQPDGTALTTNPGGLLAAVNRRKRILILMSDTGGGHRASAEALTGALEEIYPDTVDIAIVDILTDYASFPLKNSVRDYKYLAAHPWMWHFGFWFTQRQPVRCAAEAVLKGTCGSGFRQCIEDYAPDMVVSVHPLLQTVPLHVLEKMGGGRRQIPFATVVTDLGGAFPTWFHPKVDLCFVPSQQLYKMALKEGLKPHQLREHGLPVRKEFWKDAKPQAVLRSKLGLAVRRKTVLLVGGGDGVGGLETVTVKTYEKLAELLPNQTQMVVICGKNARLRESLQARQWPGVTMHIEGFTSLMSDYMGASDVLITKAGPGTIAEAAIRGLPCLLSAYLPGQEKGNIEFVEANGFGTYEPEPSAIGATVAAWLGDPERLQEMKTNARNAGRPFATYRIAQDLGTLLFEGVPHPVA